VSLGQLIKQTDIIFSLVFVNFQLKGSIIRNADIICSVFDDLELNGRISRNKNIICGFIL
jgi:hypothetical protein